MKRLYKIILISILMITSVPASYTELVADDHSMTLTEIQGNEYVSDPSTHDTWESIYDGHDTEFVGGIWTDKSVFTDASVFQNVTKHGVTDEVLEDYEKIQLTHDDHLLVSLSALGSTKEVEGYETLPTDTVFILDLSGSMNKSRSIPSMVSATNKAINDLLALNNYNRISVVLFSGDSDFDASQKSSGTILLPLAAYKTTDGDNKFIELDNNAICINENVKRVDGSSFNATRSKKVEGGTYTQNGLYLAYEAFKDRIDAGDTKIPTGEIQGGSKRIPIIVLMSDGAPTTATSKWNNVATSETGSGSLACDEFAFLTQLTAAYLKNEVSKGYDNEALFYTLAHTISSQSTTAQSVARSVLNPRSSTSRIEGYWNTLIREGSLRLRTQNTSSNVSEAENLKESQKVSITINNNNYFTQPQNNEDHPRFYVDRAFAAENAAEMEVAFENIVHEIIIQSQYHPTLITSGTDYLDGYLTFGDEIGENMEVKDIKGFVIGEKLFSGSTFAQLATDGTTFGNSMTWTTYGLELLTSIQERLSINNIQAGELLSSARVDGQISYTNKTEFSHYIGWYADENANYISFWDKDDIVDNIPNNAKYRVKSYIFQGDTNDIGDIKNTDMLHIVVRVYEDIKTGNQQVVWRIPSTLIPLVKYSVKIDSTSFETAQNITFKHTPNVPISLVFEVGLKEEINPANIRDFMKNESHRHMITDSNGKAVGYVFYSNRWGTGDDSTDTSNIYDPENHLTTVSHFSPSMENERYYFVEDTLIYYEESVGDYKVYTGNKPTIDDQNNYYHRYTILEKTGVGDQARVKYKFIPISDNVIKDTNKPIFTEDNKWYVPSGQIMRQLQRFQTPKVDNTTDTLTYARYPLVHLPSYSYDNDDYHIFTFLGNNGRLAVYSGQGFKLSKIVNDASASETFEFKVNLSQAHTSDEIEIYDENNELVNYTLSLDGKLFTFNLDANKTVTVVGLKENTSYNIVESEEENYFVEKIEKNGTEVALAEGVVKAFTIDAYAFTNKYTTNQGNLLISKVVEHPYGSDFNLPQDLTFDVKVALDHNQTIQYTASGTVNNGQAITSVTATNGIIELKLGHLDSLTIYGIAKDTEYTITEENLPTAFSNSSSTGLEGTILTDRTKEAYLINTYSTNDLDADKIELQISKLFENWGNEVFEVVIEERENDQWRAFKEVTFNAANRSTTLRLDDLDLDTLGMHYLRIYEKEEATGVSSTDHIVFDKTHYIVGIEVVDENLEGKEIKKVTLDGSEIAEVANKYSISLPFNNTHITDKDAEVHHSVDLYKRVETESGSALDLTQFTFQLTGEGRNETININSAGYANIHFDYTNLDFGNANRLEYNYELKENNNSLNNVTYDAAVYHIQVVISKANEGKVSSTLTMTKNGEVKTTAEFVNEYTVDPATLVISGTKDYKNAKGETIALKGGEFEFALFEATQRFEKVGNALCEKMNDANGSFTFDAIEIDKVGTYYYIVDEIKGDNPAITYDENYCQIIILAKDVNGSIVLEKTVNEFGGSLEEVHFENIYKVIKNATVKLGGTKNLTGKNIEKDEFLFELYQGNTKIDETRNVSGSGNFSFQEITYTEPGSYTYTIKEVDEAKPNYSYDTKEYTVNVEVVDDGKGVLTATVDRKNEENVFTNTYTPEAVIVEFEALKTYIEVMYYANGTVDEHTLTVDAGQFEFALYEADNNYIITNPTPLARFTNDANGKIKVSVEVTEPGTKYYVFKEVAGDDRTVHYDSKEHQIKITAVQNYTNDSIQHGALIAYLTIDGTVISQMTKDIEFTNIHDTHQLEETIQLKKILTNNVENLPLESFQYGFFLDEACQNPYKVADPLDPTLQIDLVKRFESDGSSSLTLLFDDKEMTGSSALEYSIYIKEVIDHYSSNVDYDDSVYRLDVRLYHNTDREFFMTYTITKIKDRDGLTINETTDTLVFENIYSKPKDKEPNKDPYTVVDTKAK